jgi:hypothetical protein
MSLKNWCITVEIDGRRDPITVGPVAHSGGFSIDIRQKDCGESTVVAKLEGKVCGRDDGELVLRSTVLGHTQQAVHTFATDTDASLAYKRYIHSVSCSDCAHGTSDGGCVHPTCANECLERIRVTNEHKYFMPKCVTDDEPVSIRHGVIVSGKNAGAFA